MARTGIIVNIQNTTLGSPPEVDGNSLLVVAGASAVSSGSMPFALDTPYMLQSVDDLEMLGITEVDNKDVFNQVSDHYSRAPGSILWLVGVATNDTIIDDLPNFVRSTGINGLQYRPRQIGLSLIPFANNVTQGEVQTVIDSLYYEGFCTVAIMSSEVSGSVLTTYAALPDLSTSASAEMVGTVIVTNRQGDRACIGDLLGYMSSLTVGTSIGEATPQNTLGDSYFFTDGDSSGGTITWINTPCIVAPLSVVNILGDKQYIFARTRPPRNGLWWNDGATAADPATALSTLEAGRTIASMVDALRTYFTPYINSRVPADSNGDIRSDYRQVVLDGARSNVIQPYIDSGDISDARMSLKAKNNDMVGTRTWEVTLEILPATTLRWIDAFVFYVNSLN